MNPNDISIIIIDNPLDQLSDPLVQMLFGQCLDLRIRSFRSQYAYGTLPFDTTDFFATHYLVGTGSSRNFTPIMGFKQVSLSRCEQFKCIFPPLALARNLNATQHIAALEEILARCKQEKNEISYLGSLVLDPVKKQSQEIPKQYLHDLFIVLQYFFAQEHQIKEGVVGTTLKFKTDRFARFLGYKPLSLNGMDLEPLAIPFAAHDLSQFHHRIGFASETIKLATQLQKVWNNVIYFGENRSQFQQAA